MARKNKRQPIATFEIPKDLIIAKEKPRYNAHQGGYGAWDDKKKYKRSREKNELRKNRYDY